jgi:hypothetical protein
MSETVPHPARSPRWPMFLGVCAATILLCAIGAEVAFVARLGPRSSAEATPAVPSPGSVASTRPEIAPEPGSLSSGKGEPSEKSDDLLRPIGALFGASLYQGYLNISLITDAVEGDLYSLADGRKLLNTQSLVLDGIEDQMDHLSSISLPERDRGKLAEFRKVLTLLRTQKREIILYWDTEDKDHAARSQKAREESRELLARLLSPKEE